MAADRSVVPESASERAPYQAPHKSVLPHDALRRVARQSEVSGPASSDTNSPGREEHSVTTTEQQPSALDEAKLNAFIGKAVDDWGTLTSAALVVIGDKLGLYTALAEGGPATPGELAQRTGTVELYVGPWLINQAAGGYLDYDATAGRYNLPPEHAAALGAVVGAYYLFTAAIKAEPRITAAFKTGQGMLWSEHDAALFAGTERFFRPGYEQNLVQSWIPAMDGVEAKLQTGATVADVGCGHGASTLILAQAYPRSRFVGFDNHEASILRARQAAADAGMADRVTFEVAGADAYPAPRQRVRAGRLFRLSARHGRPGRRDPPRRQRPDRGRHSTAGRADGRRASRGQPQPGRPRVRGRLGADLHAARRGRGRRGPGHHRDRRRPARGRDSRRAIALPARDRNTVQPRLRGAPLTNHRQAHASR